MMIKYYPYMDYVVRQIHGLPHSVGGCITYDEEGRANIYINADLPKKAQEAAIEHELWHMINNDMYNDVDPVSVLEEDFDEASD